MSKETANSRRRYQIKREQLPISCPMDDMEIWNSHPKVFLPLGDEGHATCPYCDAEFVLED